MLLTTPSQDLVLNPDSDTFYAAQLFSNFGDLGAALSSYVQSYQARTQSIHNPKSMETLADMKRFVEAYPEFKKLGGNVAKHVSLVGELSRVIERDELLGVSELEQSLAANESHAADFKVCFTSALRGATLIRWSEERHDDDTVPADTRKQ